MGMTNGEKMVWAVVYALRLKGADDHRPNFAHAAPGEPRVSHAEYTDRRSRWEAQRPVNAAEYAGTEVLMLRDALEDIKEGHGEDSEVYQMAQEMLT